MTISDEEYQLEMLTNLHEKLRQSPMYQGLFRLKIPKNAVANMNTFEYNIRYLEEKGFIEINERRSHGKITASGIDYLKDNTLMNVKNNSPYNKKEIIKCQQLYDEFIIHPEIRLASEKHYKSGQYRSAVLDAFISLETMIKKKAHHKKDERIKGKIGVDLMRHVFNLSNPVLIWNPRSDDAEIDEYKGYSHIFAGAFQGIRNPKAHKLLEQQPRRALHLLSLVNLLAEIVDSSIYVKP